MVEQSAGVLNLVQVLRDNASFVHNFTHDLGNPLTAITSFCSVIQSLQNANPDIKVSEVLTEIRTIESEAWRLAELLRTTSASANNYCEPGTCMVRDVVFETTDFAAKFSKGQIEDIEPKEGLELSLPYAASGISMFVAETLVCLLRLLKCGKEDFVTASISASTDRFYNSTSLLLEMKSPNGKLDLGKEKISSANAEIRKLTRWSIVAAESLAHSHNARLEFGTCADDVIAARITFGN